jgi:tetratricopeptide (TPR) repeat protein
VKQRDSERESWRTKFRRHERLFAAAWLGLLLVGAGVLSVASVRSGLLRGLQATVDRWDDRWVRRLEKGEALVAAGAYAEAADYLERLDRIFPARDVRHAKDKERERLLEALAQSYEALDKRSRAMATYDSLVAFDSLNYFNHFQRARAAERMLSGWALAPEARDGYAAVLRHFPSHLPSLRGYIDYYMDRGEFIPIVQAYQTYLDAYLVQHVAVGLGTDSMVVLLRTDGLPQEMELPLTSSPGDSVMLTISTGGFALRVERITIRPAVRVGVLQPSNPLELEPNPAQLHDLEMPEGGPLHPTGPDTRVAFRLPPVASGVAGIRLRLRLYKPVDEALWQLVAKSYRNILDTDGLRQAAERTIAIDDPDLADTVILGQAWAGEGLRGRLHGGT